MLFLMHLMVFLMVDMALLSIALWYIFLPHILSVPRQYLNKNKIPVRDFFTINRGSLDL